MDKFTFEIIESSLPKHFRQEEGNWTFWEHKTINIHRSILHWSANSELSYPAISDAVRVKIKEKYKASWWRGFAYGAIIDVPTTPDGIDNIGESIDNRDNKNGAWQWIILVCQESKSVVAIHTWTVGFLTPIYEAIIARYRSDGYNVGVFKKDKDKLMQFLTKMSALKGVHFQEYEPK